MSQFFAAGRGKMLAILVISLFFIVIIAGAIFCSGLSFNGGNIV